MEEDEESPSSHPSPAADEVDDRQSGSPRSPQPNGRITVNVASPALPPPQSSLTLALPIQNRRSTPPSSANAAAGGGREDCWSDDATAVLIEAWGERFVELSRGNLKQKHWEEVAKIVGARAGGGKPAKTEVQCKNRIDTVKKKYKSEEAKIAAGGGPSKWPFFDRIDRLLGNPNSAAKISPALVHKVSIGIPVGSSIYQQRASPIPEQSHRILRPNNGGSRRRTRRSADSDSEADDLSPDYSDGSPPGVHSHRRSRKRQRTKFNSAPPRPSPFEGGGVLGNPVRELTRAILKLGEAYEQAERAKLQQMVEMEKQRRKFEKELELQRMKFLMKTQLELSQLNRAGGGGDSNHQVHCRINDGNDVNNSDGSN